MKKLDDVMAEINQLIASFNFPRPVLKDVNHRLADCHSAAYAAQQLRYLRNTKEAMIKSKNESRD